MKTNKEHIAEPIRVTIGGRKVLVNLPPPDRIFIKCGYRLFCDSLTGKAWTESQIRALTSPFLKNKYNVAIFCTDRNEILVEIHLYKLNNTLVNRLMQNTFYSFRCDN